MSLYKIFNGAALIPQIGYKLEMKKLTYFQRYILLLLFFLPVLGFSRPGGHRASPPPFLAPRDREAFHLTGIIPLASAQKAKEWLTECPVDHSVAPQRKQKFCRHYDQLKRSQVSTTDSPFWHPQARLLIFGERHTQVESRDFLVQRLELLAREGFDTLAIEMLNSSAQKQLDQYLAGQLTQEELKKVFATHWNYPSKSYLQLLSQAKNLNMNIIALDNRSEVSGDMSRELIRRDRHMAKVLTQHLKMNPQSKVVALTGRLHAYRSFSQTQRPATIIEQVKKAIAGFRGQSFLMIAGQEETMFTILLQELIPNHRMKLVLSDSFSLYTNGLIHLESLDSVD